MCAQATAAPDADHVPLASPSMQLKEGIDGKMVRISFTDMTASPSCFSSLSVLGRQHVGNVGSIVRLKLVSYQFAHALSARISAPMAGSSPPPCR